MQSSKFTLIPPEIKPGDLFQALETVIPQEAILDAIAETNSTEKRERILPTHVIMALVIALNFWSTDSIVDVFKNLVGGFAGRWIPKRYRWRTPSKSSISDARQRVGPRVMTRLFERLVRPLATRETRWGVSQWTAMDGHRWHDLRLARYRRKWASFRLSWHQKRNSCGLPQSEISYFSRGTELT